MRADRSSSSIRVATVLRNECGYAQPTIAAGATANQWTAPSASTRSPPLLPQIRFRVGLLLRCRTDGVTLDQTAADKAARAGGRWLTDPSEMPYYFTGRRINDHVNLVVRFSTPWDAFIAGAPPAVGSRWPRANALKGRMPVPEKGRVRHIDLYLSANGQPYCPTTNRS
jgi:hypothetical protein